MNPGQVECGECSGTGGHYAVVSWSYRTGDFTDRETRCEACNGTGEVDLLCPICGESCDGLVANEGEPACEACAAYGEVAE
jgi:hypothetical protein